MCKESLTSATEDPPFPLDTAVLQTLPQPEGSLSQPSLLNCSSELSSTVEGEPRRSRGHQQPTAQSSPSPSTCERATGYSLFFPLPPLPSLPLPSSYICAFVCVCVHVCTCVLSSIEHDLNAQRKEVEISHGTK